MKILKVLETREKAFRGITYHDCEVLHTNGVTQVVILTDVEYKKQLMLEELSVKIDSSLFKELSELLEDIQSEAYSEGYDDGRDED